MMSDDANWIAMLFGMCPYGASPEDETACCWACLLVGFFAGVAAGSLLLLFIRQ